MRLALNSKPHSLYRKLLNNTRKTLKFDEKYAKFPNFRKKSVKLWEKEQIQPLKKNDYRPITMAAEQRKRARNAA